MRDLVEMWREVDAAALRLHHGNAVACGVIDCGPAFRDLAARITHVVAMEALAAEAVLATMERPR